MPQWVLIRRPRYNFAESRDYDEGYSLGYSRGRSGGDQYPSEGSIYFCEGYQNGYRDGWQDSGRII